MLDLTLVDLFLEWFFCVSGSFCVRLYIYKFWNYSSLLINFNFIMFYPFLIIFNHIFCIFLSIFSGGTMIWTLMYQCLSTFIKKKATKHVRKGQPSSSRKGNQNWKKSVAHPDSEWLPEFMSRYQCISHVTCVSGRNIT